jgi:hypothetical protein
LDGSKGFIQALSFFTNRAQDAKEKREIKRDKEG